MNISKIDRELHAQAMAKGHYIIAGLIADRLITTGAILSADQKANPTWHAKKRAEIKKQMEFRLSVQGWANYLNSLPMSARVEPEDEDEEEIEEGDDREFDYFSNVERLSRI